MRRWKSGFTLIEVIIVVVITSILSALAISSFTSMAKRSAMISTHAQFRQIEKALQLYYADNGEWPPNSTSGQQPAVLNSYLHGSPMKRVSALGGLWDWNGPGSSVLTYGINISVRNMSTSLRAEFDAMFDDGSPTTGQFRNDGSYLVMPVSPP